MQYPETVSKREIEISVARLSSLGWALSLSTLAALGFSSLSVVHAGWGAYANQPKSPQFRPWPRTQQQAAARWRPQQVRLSRPENNTGEARRTFASSAGGRTRMRVFVGENRSVRKAVPVTRVQGPAIRFRPKGRQTVHLRDQPIEGNQADRYQRSLHSQFRPVRAGRKATYEETQYTGYSRQAHSPGMTYLAPVWTVFGYPGNRTGW